MPIGVSRTCGCAGAAICRQRNARPPDSMLILPYRPSHTHTLLRAGTMCPLCGSSWKKRLSYRTTQSSLTVRALSSRGFPQARPVRGVLCGIAGQRHAAGDGPTDVGPEDCHDRIDRMEERSVLRRPISETTNSLSVSDRVRSILEIFSGDGLWFSRHPGSRASLSWFVRRGVLRARSLTRDPRPSRITRNL